MRVVRYLAGLLILLYLVVVSLRDDARYEANKKPRENVRQAKSIVDLWRWGATTERVPAVAPDRAVELLKEALSSDADDAVKQEAQLLLDQILARPHFVRFAAALPAFKREFPHLRSLAQSVRGQEWQNVGHNIGGLKPGRLVVTTRRHDSEQADEDGSLYFDAEMIDALGESCATTPDELRTVLILDWGRTQAGEYEVTGFAVDGKDIPYTDEAKARNPFEIPNRDAYVHWCLLSVADRDSGQVLLRRRFEAADPEFLRPGGADGYDELRTEVRQVIASLGGS